MGQRLFWLEKIGFLRLKILVRDLGLQGRRRVKSSTVCSCACVCSNRSGWLRLYARPSEVALVPIHVKEGEY